LPPEFTYHGKWSVRRVQQEKDISHIECFEQHGLYALATNTAEEFLLTDDEGQPKEIPDSISLKREFLTLDPLEFLPTTFTGALELVHPVSWKTVDTYYLISAYLTIVSLLVNTKQSC